VHMSVLKNDGSDKVDLVTFLYKLAPGVAPSSFGLNVATLAGIPNVVLEQAAAKSAEMKASAETTFDFMMYASHVFELLREISGNVDKDRLTQLAHELLKVQESIKGDAKQTISSINKVR